MIAVLQVLIQKLRASPALMALVAAVLFAFLGFLSGRFFVPTKVETVHIEDTDSKTKLQEALRVQVQLREQLTIAEKQLQEIKVKTVVVTRWVKQPNGTVTRDTTRTTDTDTKTDTTTDTSKTTTNNTAVADNTTSTADMHTHVEDHKTVTFTPRWQVTAFGTLELVGPLHPTSFAQVNPMLFYGAGAGYRFWGPLWVDLSGGGTKDLRTGANGWWVGTTLRGTFTF